MSKASARVAILLGMVTAASSIVLTVSLRRFTDSSVPFWDGLTAALSLTTQYMLSRKQLENWSVWMTADLIYIGFYCYKSLYLTGALFYRCTLSAVLRHVHWRVFGLVQVSGVASRACSARGDGAVIRGLVIGKFHPPHRSHKFLIETALAQVDCLEVPICVRPEQTISGELRLRSGCRKSIPPLLCGLSMIQAKTTIPSSGRNIPFRF